MRSKLSFSFWFGAAVIGLVLLLALLSLVWTPYDVVNLVDVGARISILVAVVAIVLGVGLGVPLGLLAAAKGGWIDQCVMRGNDLVFAFPALILAILLTALLGPGVLLSLIHI